MRSGIRFVSITAVSVACALVGCLSFDALQGATSADADAGDAATDAPSGDALAPDSSATDASSDGGCPTVHGPTMVMITDIAPAYCIDSTEVTNTQYGEFLAANVPTNGQLSPQCDANGTYLPQDDTGTKTLWPLSSALGSYPVANVDWCDAYAYCAWAGKHLCGAIGGGHLTIADHANANKSQWFHACSKGSTEQYPYGSTYTPLACNGRDLSDGGSSVPVGSLSTCVGGYPGIFDMAGNVEERVDECNDDGGCISPGGSFVDYSPSLATSCSDTSEYAARDGRSGDIGFRCCAF